MAGPDGFGQKHPIPEGLNYNLPLQIDYYSKKSGGDSMNQDLLKNVAKIIVNGDESVSQGTAFLVCNSDGTASGYLFTARHVIDGTNSEHVTLTFPKILKEERQRLLFGHLMFRLMGQIFKHYVTMLVC